MLHGAGGAEGQESHGRVLAPIPADARPRNLTDIVYENLYSAILNKTLPPGEALTEAAVAARLGVSKTPVREAFLQLRQVGLLEPDGQRGLRVIRLSPAGLRELYEVREALESFGAGRCAARADERQRRAIREAAQRSFDEARAGRLEGFRKHDRELHRLIADVGANPRIREQIDNTMALIGTLRRRDFPHVEGSVACGEAHLRIADAIDLGQPDASARVMTEHIQHVEELMLASLEFSSSDQEPSAARGI